MQIRSRVNLATTISLIVAAAANAGVTGPQSQPKASSLARGEGVTLRFDLPSQSLADAIQAVARQSNTNILVDPRLVAGRQAPAFKHQATLDEVLVTLLEGTGLTMKFVDENTIALVSSAGMQTTSHDMERVGAERYSKLRLARAENPNSVEESSESGRRADGASQAGLDRDPHIQEVIVIGAKRKFAPESSAAATKIPMQLVDTPQSISVLSAELMNIVGAMSMAEAMQWAPGVISTSPETSQYNQASVRGFGLSDFNSYKLNGLSFTGVGIPLDASVVDSIEVVRGPSSVIYGESDYGGTINVRLKQPQATPAFSGGWGGDIDGSTRFRTDVTGALTENERLRGRLSLSYADNRSSQSLAYARNTSIAPSLSWDVTERDRLDLNIILQHRPLRYSGGFGLTVDRRLPAISKAAFIGTDFALSNTDVKLGLLQFIHRFNDRWDLTVSGLGLENPNDRYLTLVTSAIAANGDVPLFQRGIVSRANDYTGDVTLTGKFMAWGQSHTVALSTSKRRSRENAFVIGSGFTSELFNVYHPDPYNSISSLYSPLPSDPENHVPRNLRFANHNVRESEGVSGMLLLHPVARTTVLLGLRSTHFESSFSDYYVRSAPRVTKADSINKRLGVVYEVSDSVNVYSSYSDGTIPNSGITASGSALPEETGVQLEAGVKAMLFDKRLMLASSVFQIDRQDIAVHDPSTPIGSPISIAIDGQKHRGVELEAIGEPLPGLNLIASYSYLDIKIDMCARAGDVCTDPFGWNGHRRPNSPKNMFKFYSTYQVLQGPLRGLSIGGGVIRSSEREVEASGQFQLPAYTRVDARLGYDALERVSFALNVINLTDEDIYTSNAAALYQGIDYQDRRTVMFDIGFKY